MSRADSPPSVVRVRSEWQIADNNPPSCALLNARIHETGITDQEVEMARQEIRHAISSGHPEDAIEVLKRLRLPNQLNQPITWIAEIHYTSSTQPYLLNPHWILKSNLITWEEPTVEMRPPPPYLRVMPQQNENLVRLELDMPLIQMCAKENRLSFTLVIDSRTLKLTAPIPVP